MTLCEKIRETAFEHGERTAYIMDGKALTYKALWEESGRTAGALSKGGKEPVLICGGKSASVLISIIACLRAKRAYVPIDEKTPEERLKSIISQTGASLLLRCEKGKSAAFEKIGGSGSVEKNCGAQNSTAYIIFTSGSTGEPKGVPVSYSNLENFLDWAGKIEGFKDLDKAKIFSSASFIFDLSIASLCLALGFGNTLLCSEKEPLETFSFIAENAVDAAVMTPTFLRLLMLEHGFCAEDFPSLKVVYLCGENLEPSTAEKFLRRFPNSSLINAYGPTEATSAVSAVKIEREMLIGKPLPVGKISTAAAEICVDFGEIILKGKSVAKGYLRPTGNAFFTEGEKSCYRTGDSGKIEGDFLYCFGRLDRQIKYKGYRIEPEEIENVLLKIEGITFAVVLAKKKGETVLYLKAFINAAKSFSEQELRQRLKSFLPEYMVPKNIVFLEKMPVTANAKTDRKRLEELL